MTLNLIKTNKKALIAAAIAGVITAAALDHWNYNRTSRSLIAASAAWIVYDYLRKKKGSKNSERERDQVRGCEYLKVDIGARNEKAGIAKYTERINKDERDVKSLFTRGVCHSNLNRHTEAIEDFEAVLRLEPRHKGAISYRAASIGATGNIEGSIEGFRQLLELNRNDYNALASIGTLFASLNKFEEAIDHLNRSIEIDDGEAGILASRGMCKYHTNKSKEAIHDLTEAMRRGYQNVLTTYYLALAQDHTGDSAEALETIAKEIDQLNDQESSLLYTAKAHINLGLENFEETIRDASAALIHNPKDHDTLAIRGTAYRMLSRFEEAVKDFSEAIEQAPADTDSLIERGECLEKLNKEEDALSDYLQASSLQPGVASTWQRIGNVQRKMGKTEEAIKAYTKRIELYGDDDAGYIVRGDSYLDLKDYKSAARDFTLAIENDASNITCFCGRAHAYINLGDYKSAEEDLNTCIKTCPETVLYYEMRAFARKELGDIDGCRTDRNQAKCLSGTEKIKRGDLDGAFEDWTEAALFGSQEAERLISNNEHLKKDAENQGLKKRLLKAVYTEELFLQFGCFSATVSPQEEMEPMGEIYKRLSEYKVEELIDDADIDAGTFDAEHPQHSIENYIRSYGFDKPWENREIMPNIENIIKYEILLYVSAAIENKSCEPRKWHKYAESIWEELMHLLGGERNMKGIAVATTEENQTLISELFNAITSKQALSDWAFGIKDAYTRLKKKVLISTQYEGGKGIDNDWTIYRAEESKAQYFGDLLNKRVLDLWQYTSWGQNGEKPVQYLRSNDANGVCVSWCSPDVDLEKERGTESCYYFVSDDGVAVVREFNEYLLLANEQHLHAAALTIIKDVMGDFEFDLVTNAFLKDTLGEELWEKIQSKERVFSPADLVPEYSIGQLRQAVINDYAYLCYQDGGTQPDETSLEDFKKKVAKMSWDELLKETSISEDVNPSLDFSLRDYIESWLAKSEYADLIYIKNEDGSTTIET